MCMNLEEYRGQNLDVWAHWMAAHTCLKGDLINTNAINYMRWPKYNSINAIQSSSNMKAPDQLVFMIICA